MNIVYPLGEKISSGEYTAILAKISEGHGFRTGRFADATNDRVEGEVRPSDLMNNHIKKTLSALNAQRHMLTCGHMVVPFHHIVRAQRWST
jgi:hypothetical protein